MTGCPPARGPDEGNQALGSGASGAALGLDVRRADERPALTLLVREGDPEPAVAAAVAVGLGAKAAVALATLVERRLHTAGYPVRADVDRFGFRLVLSPAEPAQMAGFVAALGRAFAAPVAAAEPAMQELTARWASLDRHPWPGPALEAIASCTGELGVPSAGRPVEPAPTTAAGASLVEGWRQRTLAADRAALAAVGPAPLGDALARAVQQSASWPRSAAPWPAPASRGANGTYLAPSSEPRETLLTLAFAAHDPMRAASSAVRLGEPGSPLRTKLASSYEAWELRAVRVTVTPGGGCLTAELAARSAESSSGTALATTAAAVAQLARREVLAELRREPDSFVAVRSIIAPARAADAAARAAWWSLATASPVREPTMTSALGIGSSRAGPSEEELGAIQQTFQARLAARRSDASEQLSADRRLAVERGQGELWALVGSRCGTADETPTEAGLAAIGAIAAAVAADGIDDVRVEPWLGPNGVGVVAHALPRAADESPSELAERVARVAGRAFATGPGTLATFVDARRRLTDELYSNAAALRSDLARAAIPDQASRLAPLGPPEHAKQADLERARQRWQQVMRGPIGVAVLANSDLTQAKRAAEEIDRWLLPLERLRACRADAAPAASTGRGGLYRSTEPPLGELERLAWTVVVGRPSPAERQMAELTAAALEGPGGLLGAALGDSVPAGAASVQLIEWADALALVVEIDALRSRYELVDARVAALLDDLRSHGVGDAAAKRALRVAAARRAAAREDPRRRLEALWSARPGSAPDALPANELWRAWLGEVLRPDRVVRLRGMDPPR